MADGGIGEAALMGAIIGGGSSAITGGDPLKGALMGGLTSGALGGFGQLEGVQGLGGGAAPTATPQAAGIANAGGYAANIPLGGSEAAIGNFPDGLAYNPGAGYGSALTNPVTANAADIQAFTGTEGSGLNLNNPATADKSFLGRGMDIVKANKLPYGIIAGSQALPGLMQPKGVRGTEKYTGILSKYDPYTAGRFTPYAEGGIAGLSANPNFPMSQQQNPRYAVPSQMPVGAEQIRAGAMPPVPMAHGGIADLGGYSDGGRMLKGPGDGMSDSIPASISGKQPARLADGEFVVPADVVSHLGNGSTDAGAKQLYKMMDKVRTARTGRKAQGKQINPKKYVPV